MWMGMPPAQSHAKTETTRRPGSLFPVSAMTVFEQHHRTRSSFRHERGYHQPGLSVVEGAVNTIAGYEAMKMIRKGQIRWLAKSNVAGQARFIEQILGMAT
jgi:hypothetical protein